MADGEIVKLEVTWSECQSSNVLDEYRQLQAELKNEKNEVITIQKQINTLHKQYEKYSTLRMDIRNRGEKGCNVIEKNVSPAPLFIRRPDWLADGITIESETGSMTVELQCQGDGVLEIGLLGRDVRNAEGKRYPVWIDCTYFAVNGEAVFAEMKTV